MLCLTIYDNDEPIYKFQVPGHRPIIIIIIKSLRGEARLGFEAPPEILIDRESVYLSRLRQRGEKPSTRKDDR